jgi:perosamine synthetase
MGIGPGDEVIVPNVTWVATASAVAYVGATPIFADVDPVSWTMDPASVTDLVSERTRAVMPVHLYGYPSDVRALRERLNPHIAILEDAAPAIGASDKNSLAGTFGDVAAFSFQGAKLVVGGEGGMIVTDDDDIAAEIRGLANHGRIAGGFEIGRLGYKYKMNDVTAALILGQMDHVNEMIQRKRWLHDSYSTRLSEIPGLGMQAARPNSESIHWMNSILLGETHPDRSIIMKSLRSRGVDTRPVFPLLSSFPMWFTGDDTPTAHQVAARGINLPSGVNMTDATVSRVCDALNFALNEAP